MSRVFISLYMLLVLSIIALGWGIQQVWQHYVPENDIHPEQEALMLVLANIAESSVADKHNPVDTMLVSLSPVTRNLEGSFSFYELGDFAQSSLYRDIELGEVVMLSPSQHRLRYFKRIAESKYVLSYEKYIRSDGADTLYRLLSISFYILVALVIFFWVWPLTRDLKRLQIFTSEVGKGGGALDVSISSRSAIYTLAHSFNTMALRIRELIATQKEMTHAISHELRTPLARMKFSTEFITAKVGENDTSLLEIKSNISEMEGLISEFLNYATFDKEDDRLSFQVGELEPLVRELIQRLEISVITKVINHLDTPTVRCEWYLMERCIHNLLQNAARYCVSSIEVQLSEDEEYYCVSVRDDGTGVSEAERSRIFDAFYRGEKNQDKRGFGLGLALVHRIMNWHQGEVQVGHAEKLGGAQFTLYWSKLSRPSETEK